MRPIISKICTIIILLATFGAAAVPTATVAAGPSQSVWCECVIFAMKYYGLRALSNPENDYMSAYKLVIPDSKGRTWMWYQGFGQRRTGEKPAAGDLMVMKPGTVFYYAKTVNGKTTFYSASPDAKHGHIGIVDAAWEYNKYYWTIRLRSSNWAWGVGPRGEQSGCNNVTLATIFVQKADTSISYWLKW